MHTIEQAADRFELEPVHVQVTGGNRHAAADLMGDLEASLLGIGSAHSSVGAMPEARIDDAAGDGSRWHLPGEREVAHRELRRTRRCNRRPSRTTDDVRRRDRAANRRLNEVGAYRRNAGEDDLSVWLITHAAEFAGH